MIAATPHRLGTPASLFGHLHDLRDKRGFEHIWLDATWLDDGIELRRDHEAIDALTRVAIETDCTQRARTALQLAIRLLRLHANCGCAALQQVRASLDYVLLLAEQVEMQLARQDFLDDPILIARLATLRLHASILGRLEREYYGDARHHGEGPSAYAHAPAALRLRARLLREAQRLLDDDS